MNKRYLVLDPENSDAAFGPSEEAEFWIIDGPEPIYHTGTAEENGRVESRVSVTDLLDACTALFDDHEYSGKFGVVDADKLANLQRLLRRLGEDL